MPQVRRRTIRLPDPSLDKARVRLISLDFGIAKATTRQVCVGIDQSLTAFGIALTSAAEPVGMAWLLKPKRYGSYRLHDLLYGLEEVLSEVERCGYSIEHICMEGYAHGAVNAREAMGEIAGAVKLHLARRWEFDQKGFPTIVAPQSLKKFATGKGNARKDDVKLAVYKKWGLEFSDDNLADAFVLSQVGRVLHTGEKTLQYEADVLQKVSAHTEFDQFDAVRSDSA